MAQSNEVHVYFQVTGFDGDIDSVTQIMGIAPTKAWKRGDPGRTNERWVLESQLPRSRSIEDQIHDFLPLLEARADALRTLASRFKTAFRVAAYFYDTFNPSWALSSDVVQRLASLNLSVDFDIYVLGQTSDE